MEKKENKLSLNIEAKSFIFGIVIILALMVLSYVLTFILKPGQYIDNVYQEMVEPEGGFLPFWKFLLSPILVLTTDGNLLLIAIIIFLCIIGGVFEALNKCNFIEYLLKKLVNKFYKRRYVLICVLVLFFMLLGSFVGTFEEVIPMIPFICALTTSLGFDNLIGLGMSLLSAGSGFACGIMNPFTIGVAQGFADVQLFSGAWLRIVTFVLIYFVLITFLILHAKKIEKKNNVNVNEYKIDFVENKNLDKAVLSFAIILGTGLAIVISSTVIKFLQDYTLYIIALCFLVGGVTACLIARMSFKDLLKSFGKGIITMLPAVATILLASSIRYILVESYRLDTIVYNLMSVAQGLSPYLLILFIYFIVLITEFFIASGSAKAALLIPLLIPIANAFNIPLNLICLAYIFGDGFSNYIYPTDAALLISLKLSNYNYPKYIKDTWVYHLLCLVITSAILLFGLAIQYN